MEKITVGMTIRLVKEISGGAPFGSTATIIYVDEFDRVFIDWTDGGQDSFTEQQLLGSFEIAA